MDDEAGLGAHRADAVDGRDPELVIGGDVANRGGRELGGGEIGRASCREGGDARDDDALAKRADVPELVAHDAVAGIGIAAADQGRERYCNWAERVCEITV